MGEEDLVSSLGDTDGIAISIYEVLWKKKNEKQERQSRFPGFYVNIPDTIVYNFSQPQYWYFSSTLKKVHKKKRQNLNSKNILEKFLKTKSKSGIVAVYMWKDDSPEGTTDKTKEGNGSPVCIRYLDSEGLKTNLLRLGTFNDNGVLQQFVEPKMSVDGTLKNNMIQATWQPNHLHFEKRQNRHSLLDTRFSCQQRAETFEGTFEHSIQYPIVSNVILDEITSICNRIAEHMWHVADCAVKRMVLNFRTDENNKVWLLFCSLLSVVDRDTVPRAPLELLQPIGARETKHSTSSAHQSDQLPDNNSFGKGKQIFEDAEEVAAKQDRAASALSRRSNKLPQVGFALTGSMSNYAKRYGKAFSSSSAREEKVQKKHASYLKESFTDLAWGESGESVKRIVFDSQNLLSPSQR